MKSLLCQAPNLPEVVCTPSMISDCSETIRRQMLEKHYSFSNIWSRFLCFSTVKEEKIQEKYTEKQKHALGQNRKSDAREKLFNQTLLLHPLIKSVWTVKAGHWTKHRCKAQHSCTRRNRPSTAVAAWPSLVRNCCFWWVHFWSFSSLFHDWGRGTHTDFFFPWKKPKLLGSSLQDSPQPPH